MDLEVLQDALHLLSKSDVEFTQGHDPAKRKPGRHEWEIGMLKVSHDAMGRCVVSNVSSNCSRSSKIGMDYIMLIQI